MELGGKVGAGEGRVVVAVVSSNPAMAQRMVHHLYFQLRCSLQREISGLFLLIFFMSVAVVSWGWLFWKAGGRAGVDGCASSRVAVLSFSCGGCSPLSFVRACCWILALCSEGCPIPNSIN